MSIEIKKEQEFTTTRDNQGIPTAKTAQYLIHGAVSEEEAFAALKLEAPFYLDNLKIREYEINEIKGGGAYTYDVNYTSMSDAEYGDMTNTAAPVKYSFDTSGGTANMKQALATTWDDSNLDEIPNMNNGINWDGSQFNGVDIVVANIIENHSLTIKKGKLTTEYKRTLAKLTGTVNKAKFKGWDAAEVLFLGASASDANDEYVEINFKFAISLEEILFDFAGYEIVQKKGWEYVWALYDEKNESGKPVLPQAIAVYVNQVYKETDFNQLGLGT